MKLALPVHSYRHSSRPVGCERLVNCFAEKAPPEGKAPTAIIGAPGTIPFATGSGGPADGRGIFAYNGDLYAVNRGFFFHYSSAPVATNLGAIAGTNRCSFAQNSHQIVICASPDAYVYTPATNVLASITDADFLARGGAQCVSIDNYIVFREPNTGRFFCSDLDDALSYQALNFATAEGFPDNIIGMIVDHRQIILGGSQSVELWSNVGGSGFPFARDVNGFIEMGCAAGDSFAKADNSVFWLASDLTVRRLNGLTPMRVSQHGVEQAIRTYTSVSDAFGFSYTQDGHIFYVLTFPTDLHTWVYDCTTGEWHERESYNQGLWGPVGSAFAYGRTFVQAFDTANIGSLDPDNYQEFSSPSLNPTGILRAEWTYGSIYNKNERTFHNGLDVVVESGVGLTVGQGSAPVIMLDVSDDGGRTWSAEVSQPIGAIGEYKTNVSWSALGSSYDRVYRNSISDPVKRAVADAQLDVTS